MTTSYVNDLPEEWQVMYKECLEQDWVQNSRLALDWFLSFIKPVVWDERKRNVARYFRAQQDFLLGDKNAAAIAMEEEKARIAFHEDWMGWYLYLIESIFERPSVEENSQGARIYPFFAAIGRHIALAKNIKGIDAKLNEVLNGKNNQPDATLFEIVVAITYARNGWEVEFLPETPTGKTPDLLVSRGKETFYVECKRQSKVTEYSELERKAWRARWSELVSALMYFNKPVFVDVTFKTEVVDTQVDIVKNAFLDIMKQGELKYERIYVDEVIRVSARPINISKVNENLNNFFVRQNSPQLVSLLANGFKSSESYTHLIAPAGMVAVGPDDEYHALNVFCTGVHQAYCARWQCVDEASIDKKAKDVKKLLSKAVNQAPAGFPTIVHIAYETLHGPHIEFIRAAKIETSLRDFDCKGKNICAIYCHAIQPSVSESDWEIAETTMRFGKNGFNPERLLSHDLMFDQLTTEIHRDTHWNQDLNALK
ncbi:hypothetical protein [Pantoea dispersa]|uniref:hypothetical protein n=1 Tax=Pantoea TaxID=53335 RepID=UPI0039BE052F